jgi:hypothetical protein
MEELLGDQTLPVEPEEESDFDWGSIDEGSEHLLLRPWDDDWESEEQQTLPIQAQNNIDHNHTEQPAPSTDWELSEELRSLLADHDDEEAALYKKCNYSTAAVDLQRHNHFFSFAAIN